MRDDGRLVLNSSTEMEMVINMAVSHLSLLFGVMITTAKIKGIIIIKRLYSRRNDGYEDMTL